MKEIQPQTCVKGKGYNMTAPTQNQVQDAKPSDKELNFRQLEAKYQRQLEQERTARIEAERQVQEKNQRSVDDDDDSDPYVDHKKLDKKLAKFGQQQSQQTQTEINRAVQVAIQEERKNSWIKNNPDFYAVLQHAEKFAERAPDLAESILDMPEGFERQKLVYKNIKALNIDKPEVKSPSIQEKIDSNRRSPYYQPGGVGSAPYASAGDFSASGQKNAYDKMQELKSRLRI